MRLPTPINQDEFWQRPLYRTAAGVEYFRKPGRLKKLSAVQAATIFQVQVETRAAKRLIDRILDEAGVGQTSRTRVLKLNWADRGRIDVLHAAPKKKAKR